MRTVALLLATLPLAAAACVMPAASLHDVETAHAQSAGTTRLYEVSADRALDISREILKKEGGTLILRGDQPNELLTTLEVKGAQHGIGTHCGVWVAPQDETHSRVTVVTMREARTVTTVLTEGTFHEEFAKAVAANVTAAPAPAK